MTALNEEDKAKRIYLETIDYLLYAKGKILEKSPFDIEPAAHLVETIIDDPGLISGMLRSMATMPLGHVDDYNISHQTNDMLYALKIGMGLQYSKKQLFELGLSSLLHDVGMFVLPKSVVFKAGELTASEIELMRKHAAYGKEILSSFGSEYSFLVEVAYQHHERLNGSGYPQGLRGTEINEYAQVLCLMDIYEAMINDRPNRKALNQTVSAKELLAEAKETSFPPRIIKVFLEEITLYPEGSYVRLNNGSIAEVIATRRSYPLRPDVRILFDGCGFPVSEEKIICLRENPLFFIADNVSPGDLKKQMSFLPL